MRPIDWMLGAGVAAMSVLAGMLAFYVGRMSRWQRLERDATYTWEIKEGAPMPLAPGTWTVAPGRGKLYWTGPTASARKAKGALDLDTEVIP